MNVLFAQSCLSLCNPMDGSLTDSSVPGILQARILEWVAILITFLSPLSSQEQRIHSMISKCIWGEKSQSILLAQEITRDKGVSLFFQREINGWKDNQKLIRKAVNKGCVRQSGDNGDAGGT